MMLRLLPLLAGILPLVAMFGALWLGIANETIKSCIPFIEGCLSISATGRTPPGSFLFRAIMMPQAVVLFLLWYFCVHWLRSFPAPLKPSMARAILLSGVIGTIALIVYVTFLGTKEPVYEFMRRIGIYFGFLGTALAQVFTAIALARSARRANAVQIRKMANFMLGLCAAAFALGVLNIVFRAILEDPDPMENRIEWIASVVMQIYFFVLYRAWRKTSFNATISSRFPDS
jgi:hypothetical protein